jgi:riboflavin-specific deaminase-like protein
MRRLLPDVAETSPEEAYADLGLAERAGALTRPYVVANMVTTADGHGALGGRTRDLSSPADRRLFHALRDQIDAVMAGTATISIERYGPLVREPERRERRAARGLAPLPLAVTASRSLALPVTAPLLEDPESTVVVLAGGSGEPPPTQAEVIVERVAGPDERTIDFLAGMELLRAHHGVRTLLLEGGPTLLGAMLEAGLVDELFLTVAPLLVGGGPEPAIVEGPPLPAPLRLRLKSLLEDSDYLFGRYSVDAIS